MLHNHNLTIIHVGQNFQSSTKYICFALLQGELETRRDPCLSHMQYIPPFTCWGEGGREDGETTCLLYAIRLVDALSKSYLCMSTNINPKLYTELQNTVAIIRHNIKEKTDQGRSLCVCVCLCVCLH